MTATVSRGTSDVGRRDDLDDEVSSTYSAKVGDRIRTIRRQKRMSLQDVEELSDHEFKASVLGAYERGERSISVPRLQRLAEFYEVPVDQLLPSDGLRPGAGGSSHASENRAPGAVSGSLTIDLRRAQALVGSEGELLKRYLAAIQVQRQDFNGRVLTIRAADLQALSCLFGVAAERVQQRMRELRLITES